MLPRIILITLLTYLFTHTVCAEPASTLSIYPKGAQIYDKYPNSIMYYYGHTMNTPLIRILTLHDYRLWPEQIQSLDFEYTLCEDNLVRRFFNPIVGVVQIAGDISVRYGQNQHTIYEFDPYIMFRWANLPWNDYINTSFGLGEGISYVTSVPWIELKDNNHTKRLLNYLAFEATFAHPCYPRLQAVLRVHHRSGAYGLYRAGNTGSNELGAGIRYLFD